MLGAIEDETGLVLTASSFAKHGLFIQGRCEAGLESQLETSAEEGCLQEEVRWSDEVAQLAKQSGRNIATQSNVSGNFLTNHVLCSSSCDSGQLLCKASL